ncbi:acyl-CoA carboxylase subunit epsilon [Streptomyces sp. NK08204]|uniref:acyl-CoA carboxylase subunit epsilon n=1 Tax=Streptomyces sp. NK08204 TaxID=2873260 RepID=UPI0035A8A137
MGGTPLSRGQPRCSPGPSVAASSAVPRPRTAPPPCSTMRRCSVGRPAVENHRGRPRAGWRRLEREPGFRAPHSWH